MRTIEMSGWAGLGLKARVHSLFNLATGLKQSRRILKEFGPDVIVGVGGYASVPVLLAAKWLKMPYLIHEQNAWPGMANRLLGRWARRICLSFEEAAGAFPGKLTIVTGNPVRAAMERCRELNSAAPQLLVFGGSHGARAISRGILAALPHLETLRGKLHIVHQTGQLDYDEVLSGYRDAGWTDVEVLPFIKEMAQAYQRASLVVCRAGATSLAELTACGRPAILVPYPHAAGGHQTANARALADKGAAILLEEKELTPERLGHLITDLLGDDARLHAMAAAGKALARTGAAKKLLDECRNILGATD